MFLRLFLLLIIIIAPVRANTPNGIEDFFKKEYPKAQIRLDGLLQLGDKLWLPFVNGAPEIEPVVLNYKSKDDDYLFSNGWVYVPIKDNTVRGFDYYDEKIQAQILLDQITPGFLIPKGFSLPRDLAITAGRLPIELRTVELASDRELKFKERLKQEQTTKPLRFLSYSVKSGMLSEVELIHNDKGNDKNSNNKVTKQKELSEHFSYLSNIKRINSKIYFVDYTRGKVSMLNEEKAVFDARKPDELPDANLAVKPQDYKLEEVASLSNYEMKTGLQDFALSDDYTAAYLLTNVDPKLLIVDLRAKKLIKAVTVPPGTCDLTLISRNSSEPSQLYMISKSNSKLIIVNTFDYRISNEIDLNLLGAQVVPHSLVVNTDKIYIGVEVRGKESATGEGRILILDTITYALVSTVKLDYVPYELSLAAEPNMIYALGSNSTSAYISKINIESIELVKTASLGPDIQSPKAFALSQSGYFLFIPSPGTETVGVLDVASWELVYKIDIGDRSNVLLSL